MKLDFQKAGIKSEIRELDLFFHASGKPQFCLF